jgi:hypothetical protein
MARLLLCAHLLVPWGTPGQGRITSKWLATSQHGQGACGNLKLLGTGANVCTALGALFRRRLPKSTIATIDISRHVAITSVCTHYGSALGWGLQSKQDPLDHDRFSGCAGELAPT